MYIKLPRLSVRLSVFRIIEERADRCPWNFAWFIGVICRRERIRKHDLMLDQELILVYTQSVYVFISMSRQFICVSVRLVYFWAIWQYNFLALYGEKELRRHVNYPPRYAQLMHSGTQTSKNENGSIPAAFELNFFYCLCHSFVHTVRYCYHDLMNGLNSW